MCVCVFTYLSIFVYMRLSIHLYTAAFSASQSATFRTTCTRTAFGI